MWGTLKPTGYIKPSSSFAVALDGGASLYQDWLFPIIPCNMYANQYLVQGGIHAAGLYPVQSRAHASAALQQARHGAHIDPTGCAEPLSSLPGLLGCGASRIRDYLFSKFLRCVLNDWRSVKLRWHAAFPLDLVVCNFLVS